jgi:uncharacterized DUF497 family protein
MIRWNNEKDLWLQEHRGVSFQDIATCILSDNLIDMIENPSRDGQEAFVIRFREYIWVVPFVLGKDDSIFLKTAYPSRKMNALYGGPNEEKNHSQ